MLQAGTVPVPKWHMIPAAAAAMAEQMGLVQEGGGGVRAASATSLPLGLGSLPQRRQAQQRKRQRRSLQQDASVQTQSEPLAYTDVNAVLLDLKYLLE